MTITVWERSSKRRTRARIRWSPSISARMASNDCCFVWRLLKSS
jgi:ATP-dependent DNA helicase, Rep family